jgi:hypothetical protein
MDQTTETLVKGGICWFTMSITRGKNGLIIYTKTDPRIEDFFQSLGQGQKEPPEAFGPDWYAINKPLHVHGYYKALPTMPIEYSVNMPGGPFTIRDKNRPIEVVNISFLRLIGIGSPEGVSFGVVGPFSRDYIRETQGKILRQVRNLVQEYVLPVNINLRISSQEV